MHRLRARQGGVVNILDRKDLQIAAKHFAVAAAASRAQSELAHALLKKHGDHGPNISGIFRDHFPEKQKDRLRKLCHVICEENDLGIAARPKGVHKSTMFTLARAVCKRDGTGFYGFRA